MNPVENIREEAIRKRQRRGQTGFFTIYPGRGEHPFFQMFSVHSTSFLQHHVEIHTLFTDESNTCTCRDWATSGLETCKHIEAVIHYLRNLNPSAFTWTLQKTPYLEDAVFAHVHKGRACLRMRMSAELQKSKSFSFVQNYGAIIDGVNCILPDPAHYAAFLQQARENRIRVCESVAPLMANVHMQHACIPGEPRLFVFHSPQGPLSKPLKSHQIPAVHHLLSYPEAVIAEPAGTGKRVSALAAAVQIRQMAPPAPVVLVCDAAWMAQWKRLIQVFDPNSVYLFGDPKGRGTAFERKYQYYIAAIQTLRRDANWIRKIAPHVLIFDEFWMLSNWRGSVSSLLKSLSAPHVFWLTSHPIEKGGELEFQLAQYMFPQQVGAVWNMKKDTSTSLNETVQQHLAQRILSRTIDELQEVRRPKLRVMVKMSSRQATIANDELNKLVALASANYTWSGREVTQVVEKIQQLRLGMSVPAFLGAPRESRSIKMDALARIVAMEARQGRRVLVFSHWPEIGPMVQEAIRRCGVRVRLLHGLQDVQNMEWSKYPVAVAFDQFLDFRLSDVDVVANLDLPWEKSLYNARKSVCDLNQSHPLVEYNFVVMQSVEDRGLVVLETLPHLLRGFDGSDVEPGGIDPINLRTLVRKLAGRREERIASSSQASIKVDRVSSRERKVVSRKGLQEVDRPSTFRSRGIFSSMPAERAITQVVRRARVYTEGDMLAELENSVLLLHFEVDSQEGTAVFASVIEPRSRRAMGWTTRHFPVLARLLSSAQVVIGSCSMGQFSKIFQDAFGVVSSEVHLIDLQKLVENVTQEQVELRNLLEATCGRKVLWDAMEVRRLSQSERWQDLLELGQSELRMIWELLNYMVRESRFFCRIDNERQAFWVEMAAHLPATLYEMLQRTSSF